MKRLSVIIISWNEKSTLKRCLDSFYEKFDFDNDEILIIDNGSHDGTTEEITRNYSKAKYYHLPQNIGVGPARNRGIIMSTGKYIMTLDNDTIINNCNFGATAERFFSETPNAGVIGFRLLNKDLTHQQSCRRFPGLLQPLAARIKPLQKIKKIREIQNSHMMTDIDFSKVNYPYPVDYILGANQVFTRELAMRLYCYDEKVFFGPEDFDFCLRAKKLGKTNYILDDITIIHDYQRRTKKLSILTLKHVTAYYYVMKKNKISSL